LTGLRRLIYTRTVLALRLLLVVLGGLMAAASRWSEAFRRQLTRDLVIEIRSDDGVARHFVFRNRRASSIGGRAEQPDLALRFATARQAFSVLTAKEGPARLLDGLLDGTIRLEGRTMLLGWFQGLVASVVPGASVPRFPATPPGAYVTPSSSEAVSRFITREPPERELDPSWTDAVAAREKLAALRAIGERGSEH
jgi:hypothetical protein